MGISRDYLGGAAAPNGLLSFYFLRHGSTDLNSECQVDGRPMWYAQGAGTNASLNEEGTRQARLAGGLLRRLEVKRVFCSPLARTIETAFSANLGCAEFHLEDDLKERDFGKHEGKLAPLELFEGNYESCENTEAFSRRVAAALSHARKEGTLLVSSGGVLRVIGALLGVELLAEHLRNGRVLRFQSDGSKWAVKTYESPVVLVSGANRGIGLAIAKELLGHGYRVSLGARKVEELKAAFGPENRCFHYARFDAEDPNSMEEWVEGAAAKFERIDGLVNNAGYGEHVPLDNVDYGKLGKQWTINSVAPLRMTELCLPYLKSAGCGRIVNINSMSGLRVLNPFVGYNMTKAALRAVTQTTQHVAWEDGVRATSICPGFVATEMSSYTDLIKPEEMIQPNTIAELVRLAIELPNNATVPEMQVRCQREPQY